MKTLTETLFEREKTEAVLPLNPEKAQSVLNSLDGTTDRILLAIPTGKCEVWTRMAKSESIIINDSPITRIGEYDVPGTYKFSGYTSR